VGTFRKQPTFPSPCLPPLACPAANESTNSRVVWFSVLELVTMVAIGGWQVFTLRRFFEQKGRV